MWFTTQLCEYCRHALDTHIGNLSSGLGPPTVTCPRCDTVNHTRRKEWTAMRSKERRWFLLLSLVYTPLVAGFGGMSSYLCYTAIRNIMDLNVTSPVFQGLMLFWGVLVIGFQGYRVRTSNERVAQRMLAPYPKQVRGNLDVQVRFCELLLMPFLIGWCIEYFGK